MLRPTGFGGTGVMGRARAIGGRGLAGGGLILGGQALGNAVGPHNPVGSGLAAGGTAAGLSTIAGVGAGTGGGGMLSAAGLNPVTGSIAAGVGLGTVGAKLINPDNSWGNVWRNTAGRWAGKGDINDALGTLAASGTDLESKGAILDAARDEDENSVATLLAANNIGGAEFTEDGEVVLSDQALKTMEALRANKEWGFVDKARTAAEDLGVPPEQVVGLAADAYISTLAEGDGSDESKSAAVNAAEMAVEQVTMETQAEEQALAEQQRFNEFALAYQSAANEYMQPSLNAMRARADADYATLTQSAAGLPPAMQASALADAELRRSDALNLADAYQAQTSMLMPSMAYAQQQEREKAMFAQYQQQVDQMNLQQVLAQQYPDYFGDQGGAAGLTAEDLGALLQQG